MLGLVLEGFQGVKGSGFRVWGLNDKASSVWIQSWYTFAEIASSSMMLLASATVNMTIMGSQ